MDKIRLRIVTSDGKAWERAVSSVTLPTSFGSLGVLSGHAPMLCAVKKGVLKCRFGEGESARVEVCDGIANVTGSEVTILTSDLQELV